MGMLATGAYLRYLRESLSITQDDAGAAISHDTDRKTIGNWEAGRTTPNAEVLARYVEFLHGSAVQVHELLINPRATVDDGKAAARVWRLGGTVASNPESLSDEQLVIRVASDLFQLTEVQKLRLIAVLLGQRPNGA